MITAPPAPPASAPSSPALSSPSESALDLGDPSDAFTAEAPEAFKNWLLGPPAFATCENPPAFNVSGFAGTLGEQLNGIYRRSSIRYPPNSEQSTNLYQRTDPRDCSLTWFFGQLGGFMFISNDDASRGHGAQQTVADRTVVIGAQANAPSPPPLPSASPSSSSRSADEYWRNLLPFFMDLDVEWTARRSHLLTKGATFEPLVYNIPSASSPSAPPPSPPSAPPLPFSPPSPPAQPSPPAAPDNLSTFAPLPGIFHQVVCPITLTKQC